MTKSGIEYELFVQKIQQAIIDSEPYAAQKNIIVEHDKKLIDRCGIERQFDLYWEYELGGFIYKNIVECKDFENGVPIDKLDALIGKMHDLPGIRAIIATRVKFQSGAIKKAQANNIDAIIVRDEDIEKDWTSSDGTPLIRSINFQIHCVSRLKILSVNMGIDKEWVEREHISPPSSTLFLPTEVFLEKSGQPSITLQEYIEKNHNGGDSLGEEHIHKESFDDAFIVYSETLRLKLKGFEIKYIIPKPLEYRFTISPEVTGVVEYLNQEKKKMIFNEFDNLQVKDWQ